MINFKAIIEPLYPIKYLKLLKKNLHSPKFILQKFLESSIPKDLSKNFCDFFTSWKFLFIYISHPEFKSQTWLYDFLYHEILYISRWAQQKMNSNWTLDFNTTKMIFQAKGMAKRILMMPKSCVFEKIYIRSEILIKCQHKCLFSTLKELKFAFYPSLLE